MTKAKVLAFGHQKDVGKDQFVRFIIDILRPQCPRARIVQRGFVTKLYEFLHQMYGWAGFQTKQYYDTNKWAKAAVLPKIGKTPRQLLIEMGDHLRLYDPKIWHNAMLLTEDYDFLFITDLRYEPEVKAVLDAGGMAIKITRPGLPEPTDSADTALNGFCGWSLTIHNNGDLASLYKLAETVVKEYIL